MYEFHRFEIQIFILKNSSDLKIYEFHRFEIQFFILKNSSDLKNV